MFSYAWELRSHGMPYKPKQDQARPLFGNEIPTVQFVRYFKTRNLISPRRNEILISAVVRVSAVISFFSFFYRGWRSAPASEAKVNSGATDDFPPALCARTGQTASARTQEEVLPAGIQRPNPIVDEGVDEQADSDAAIWPEGTRFERSTSTTVSTGEVE